MPIYLRINLTQAKSIECVVRNILELGECKSVVSFQMRSSH